MVSGSCLCEAVRWQADSVLDDMSHCHCSMCRKVHAAPFATYVSAKPEGFRWLSGEDLIVHYESSPGFIRAFCGRCGSVVPDTLLDGRVSMPAGCFDEDPGVRPTAHIFATSKAPWHVISDSLAQLEGYANPADGQGVERPAIESSRDGVLRGSCMCAEVAYEVRTPIVAVHNCHCSRCRKARAAAHATNGVTAIEGVTFTRGESNLRSYKVPSARFFAQVFCKRCGSGMPRLDSERGIAVIPFGSLDDDPGRGADDHIFVASMAPWYTITDSLPCFEEMPG